MDLSQRLKQLKKDLVNFRKKVKVDALSGEDDAEKMLKEVKIIKSYKEYTNKKKLKTATEQIEDTLNMYLINIKSISQFNKKWGNKKND